MAQKEEILNKYIFTFCLCSLLNHWDPVRSAEIHRRNANQFWEYVAGQDT